MSTMNVVRRPTALGSVLERCMPIVLAATIFHAVVIS